MLQPANLLTIARLLLSPVLFWLVLDAEADRGASWEAFGLGMIMAATDFFDGWAARRAAAVSRSGAFLDPLADKVVILGVGSCLVAVDRYWWLPVAVIAARELGITAWRTRWARAGVVIPARRSAKYKAALQGLALSLAVFPPLSSADTVVVAALWLAVAFTLISGLQYVLDGSAAARGQRDLSPLA